MLQLSNIYLFRYDGDDMVHSLSVWVPKARKREQALHERLDQYRVDIRRRMPKIPVGCRLYKIGISEDATDRLEQVNANPRNGGTEYFVLPYWVAIGVRNRLRLWWLQWLIIQLLTLSALGFVALKYLQ